MQAVYIFAALLARNQCFLPSLNDLVRLHRLNRTLRRCKRKRIFPEWMGLLSFNGTLTLLWPKQGKTFIFALEEEEEEILFSAN